MAAPPVGSPPPAPYQPVVTYQPPAYQPVDEPPADEPPAVLDPQVGQWAPPGEPGTFLPPPPPATGRLHLRTFLAVGGAVLGFIGGTVLFNTLTDREPVPFTETSENLLEDVQLPRDYEGPTFSVRLPGSPAVDVVSEGGVSITTYIVEVEDRATGVAVFELQPDEGFDLEAGAQGVADEIGGTIASVSAVDLGGLPGGDYRIDGAMDGEATAWGRFIVTDSKLYQIMTVLDGDFTEPPAEHLTALETFALR